MEPGNAPILDWLSVLLPADKWVSESQSTIGIANYYMPMVFTNHFFAQPLKYKNTYGGAYIVAQH